MGFFDFLKDKTGQVDDIQLEKLVFDGGMRLDEAEVDIMFIVKNNQVIYVNNDSEHLFILD